jgi:purine nucleosidase
MTVVDWWSVAGKPANAFVVRDLDADAYFDLVIDRMGRL